MNVQEPIGIFDSGLGGLSVAREIRRLLPEEALIYIADSRYCPYGVRSEPEILSRSTIIADALVAAGAKLLVIACNTATAVALEALRSRLPVPIVGLEPAVKPAVERSRSRVVGVLATPRTASSERLSRLIDRFAGDGVTVHVVPAPGLVELVESGSTSGDGARELVRSFVGPLVEQGVDTIVLGCTHYPFLAAVIREVVGAGVEIIDSGAAIARRTSDLLAVNGLRSTVPAGSLDVLTTGNAIQVREVAERLLGEAVRVRQAALAYDPPLKCSAAWTSSTAAGA
jgi:glutamate racemase